MQLIGKAETLLMVGSLQIRDDSKLGTINVIASYLERADPLEKGKGSLFQSMQEEVQEEVSL